MLSGLYFTVSVKLRVLIASLGCRHRGLDRRIVRHCTLKNLPHELPQSKFDTNPAGNAAASILLRNFKQRAVPWPHRHSIRSAASAFLAHPWRTAALVSAKQSSPAHVHHARKVVCRLRSSTLSFVTGLPALSFVPGSR